MTRRRDVRRLNAQTKIAHARQRLVANHAAVAHQCSVLAVSLEPDPATSLAIRLRTVSAVVVDLAADVRIPDGCIRSRPLAVTGQGLTNGVGVRRPRSRIQIHVIAKIRRSGREDVEKGGDNELEFHSRTLPRRQFSARAALLAAYQSTQLSNIDCTLAGNCGHEASAP